MGYQNVLIGEYEYTTLSLSQILARQNFGPWQLTACVEPTIVFRQAQLLDGIELVGSLDGFFYFFTFRFVRSEKNLSRQLLLVFSLHISVSPHFHASRADIYTKFATLSQKAWNGISKQSSRTPLLMLVWPTFLMSLSYTTDRRIRDQRHTYLWHSPRGP